MQAKSVRLLFALLLGASALFAQQSALQVREQPPESIPHGTCKESYSGYLETGKPAKVADLTSVQIGDYVKQRLSEGYILSLYPQASGRAFVIATCPAKN